jgi:RAB protein geranylgeranyltransferase component A
MKSAGFFTSGGAAIYKIPANDKEALKSDLLGWNEKRKCKNFFQYI